MAARENFDARARQRWEFKRNGSGLRKMVGFGWRGFWILWRLAARSLPATQVANIMANAHFQYKCCHGLTTSPVLLFIQLSLLFN